MNEPPFVLVKTWYEMLVNSSDKQLTSHAEKMLIGAFGTQEAVASYLKKHKLIN